MKFVAPEPRQENAFEQHVESADCMHISTKWVDERGGPYDSNEFFVQYCNDCDGEVYRALMNRRAI